jgi:hypothetical protein
MEFMLKTRPCFYGTRVKDVNQLKEG